MNPKQAFERAVDEARKKNREKEIVEKVKRKLEAREFCESVGIDYIDDELHI